MGQNRETSVYRALHGKTLSSAKQWKVIENTMCLVYESLSGFTGGDGSDHNVSQAAFLTITGKGLGVL